MIEFKNTQIEKGAVKALLKGLSYIFLPLIFLISCFLLEDAYNAKLMRSQGVDTECVMIAYGEGSIGSRSPKKGYKNQFQYFIGDSIHYCYVFTSKKPLPFDMKLKVRYLQKKNGRVIINFPVEYKEMYKEYGFNDYGY